MPSHRSFVRRAAAVTAVAALAAAVTPAASTALSATSASTPACSAAGLVNWIDTNSNGAAGTIFYQLQFTNLSGRRCTLRGYPGVSGVDLRGHRLGAAARRSTNPVRVIALNNGATAKAVLGIVEAGNFPPATCKPTTAAGLRVFAPNQSTSKLIPFPFGVCSHGPSNLSIRPVTH
ncbi:MAG: DUF4232 domain-containing protein [Solirubrobacteraceae bacterium]